MKRVGLSIKLLIPFFLLVIGVRLAGQDQAEFSALWEQGQTLRARGSYALAESTYNTLLSELSIGSWPELSNREALVLEVEYLKADSLWRSQAGRDMGDYSQLEIAVEGLLTVLMELEELAQQSGERPSELYPQVHASLGALHLEAFPRVDWSQSWTHYNAALQWWGKSTQIERATEAYIRLVREVTRPFQQGNLEDAYAIRFVPTEVIDNFLRIAKTEEDLAYGNYLFAMAMNNRGYDPRQRLRISEAFQNALKWAESAQSPWLDDVLFAYGQWLEREGRLYFDDDGNMVSEPNFERAVDMYEQLLATFDAGESQYWRAAQRELADIRRPQLSVLVSHVYLPGSEVSFSINSRNLDSIEVNLFPITLNSDLRLKGKIEGSPSQWVDQISTELRQAWKSYTLEPEPPQVFGFWNEAVRVDAIPETGAYLIEARSGDMVARDLLLITEQMMVMKQAGNDTLVFLANTLSGSPVEEASVHFQVATAQSNGEWLWESQEGQSDTNGLVQFKFGRSNAGQFILATSNQDGHQTLAYAGVGGRSTNVEQWEYYTFADRSLYQPGDTVNWKLIARERLGGKLSVAPQTRVSYRIISPRGEAIEEGELELNTMGSAFAQLDLEEGIASPLGVYSIEIASPSYAYAVPLFRVEEVELPEFRVAVETLGEGEMEQSAFQLGDPVELEVTASYNSGGPLVGAGVEVLVYEDPLYRVEPLTFSDRVNQPRRQTPSRVISRQTFRTDSEGKVQLSLPEPTIMNQDLEYTVEARVRDEAGVEIVSSKSIRMTRQPYFVWVRPEFQLYRPGDTVEVLVKAVDGNDLPVSVSGRLILELLEWEEIWVDPRGHQISGAEYYELRNKRGFFRAFRGDPSSDYRMLRQGYKTKPVETLELETNADGQALYSRDLDREGYYRLRWVSEDQTQIPIKAETHFYSADQASNDIGYYHGGLSIVVDESRFRAGVPGPIMITSPGSGRTVLFTVGSDQLGSTRVLGMDGTIKLLEVTFAEEHVPETWVEATMVFGNQLYTVQKQIQVPPIENEIDVRLTPNELAYLPRETGAWEIQTLDKAGNPISAEVALSVVDDAGFQIQPDFAGDPLDFFFGKARPFRIQTLSSYMYKNYRDNRPDPLTGMVLPDDSNSVGLSGERIEALSPFETEMVGFASTTQSTLAGSRLQTAPMMQADMVIEESAALQGVGAVGGVAESPLLRENFNPALFWNPIIQTDADGRATIQIEYSDSLTQWRGTARAVASGNRFGQTVETVRTRLPLIARLPLPDYLVEGDTVEISGLVQNNAEIPLEVRGNLETSEAGGLALVDASRSSRMTEFVNAEGGAAFRWRLRAGEPGETELLFSAESGEYGDRLMKPLEIVEHGMPVILQQSGYALDSSFVGEFDIPADRKLSSTKVIFRMTPHLGILMLDVVESLVESPDRTSENLATQLMGVLILEKAFKEAGLSVALIADLFEAQGVSRDTWLAEQLGALLEMELGNGSWPWHRAGEPDLFMTAHVLWALGMVREAGLLTDSQVLERGQTYVRARLVEREFDVNTQAWLLHALATRYVGSVPGDPTRLEAQAFSNIWKNRPNLDSFGMALLAETAYLFGLDLEHEILVENLMNGRILSQDSLGRPQASWAPGTRSPRYHRSRVETTGMVMGALSQHTVETAVLDAAHHWLLQNRKAASWMFGRESLFGLIGLSSVMHRGTSASGGGVVDLLWNGELLQEISLDPEAHNWQQVEVSLHPDQIMDGLNTFTFQTHGVEHRVYGQVVVEFYSEEIPIPARGNEIQIERSFEHLMPVATLLEGVVESRIPIMSEGQAVRVGDRLDVHLVVTVDNNYPYVVLTDRIPAGFESARQLSGGPVTVARVGPATQGRPRPRSGRRSVAPPDRLSVYQEVRAGEVVFYIDQIPEGTWDIQYTLRGETPGRFHALPSVAVPRYLPETRGSSDEIILQIRR